MLELFRRNLITNVIAIFVFTLVIFAYYLFMQDSLVLQPLEIPFQDIHGLKIPFIDNVYVQYFLGVILIFAQAMMVSQLVIKHKMSRNLSLIPSAVMVLFLAIILQPSFNHIVLVANFFFLLSISMLFRVYKVFNPISTIFNSGFFIGVATFLYRPYFVYFLVILLGLLALRSLKLKEILQVTLGFLCPLFLIGVLMYFNDGLGQYFSYGKIPFSVPSIDFGDVRSLFKPLLAVIVILVLVFNQNALRKKKKFDAIKKIELNYWNLLISVFSLFFVAVPFNEHLILISLPIALLGGLILESKENAVVKEFIFLSFVGLYIILVLGVI